MSGPPVLPARRRLASTAAADTKVQIQDQAKDPSLPATTTFQQDKVTEGQRHINVMWERTQQVIAIVASVTTLGTCSYLVLYGDSGFKAQAFTLLSNVFFLVVGTYFQRTNHTKTGGVSGTDVGR